MIEVVSQPCAERDSDRIAGVLRAIQQMHQELDRPHSLSDLAGTASFSPYHFHRIFRKITRTTPARFLAALRMAEAGRLLLHSQLTAATVGSQVGYTSTGTFTTQFTRLVGVPPHRFRRLVRRVVDQPIGHLLAAAGLAAPAHPDLPDPHALVAVGLLTTPDAWPTPDAWGVVGPSGVLWLDAGPAVGEYPARVLLVDGRTTPAGALVDRIPGSYLTGTARVRIASARSGTASMEVSIHRPQQTDPPVLSVAPLRWLAGVALGTADQSPRMCTQ